MSNYVFLIDAAKTPMNPIHPAHAKKLLTSGKAAVFRRYPFTLILKRRVSDIVTHPLSLRIDPGSKITGITLVTDREQVLWAMELEHRGNVIKNSLEKRRLVRRARRSRNTRYRQPRFLNRTRPKGWLAPSIKHRVLTTMTWVKRMCKFAPIGEIRLELVKFDTQKIDNPEISGIEYQQGELAGYEVKEYLLEKWGRNCVYCHAQNVPLEVEHIVPKSKGGTNRVSNLTIACNKCNQAKGSLDIKDFLSSQPDLLTRILKQTKIPLKDATVVNSCRWDLFNNLKSMNKPVLISSGGRTKYNRTRLNLPKTHWIDAACVGLVNNLTIATTHPLLVQAKGHGNRQYCRMNKYGFPCSKPRQSHTHGWKTGDIGKVTKNGITYVGRIVPQSNTRLEIRIGKQRIGSKVDHFTKIHSKDGYTYK